jgi:hypothetical protein
MKASFCCTCQAFVAYPWASSFSFKAARFSNVPPVFKSESGAQNALPKVVRIIP